MHRIHLWIGRLWSDPEIFEGQLKVTHDLDFDETLIVTFGVTRPCWNGILSLCLMFRFWDHLPNVEKSHSKFIYIKIKIISTQMYNYLQLQ